MNESAKPPIRFKFDVEKLVASLCFFASNTKGLDKLKAAKLLYFADKYHLLKYGRPILGDTYFHLDYGPVPSVSLDIMNEAIAPYRLDIPQENLKLLKDYLKVDPDKKHPVFEVKKQPDLDVLSESEVEALQETIKVYGGYTGPKLIDLTHREASWRKTGKNEQIDYRLFFEGERNGAIAAHWEQRCRTVGAVLSHTRPLGLSKRNVGVLLFAQSPKLK